jgi:hypothetical protein
MGLRGQRGEAAGKVLRGRRDIEVVGRRGGLGEAREVWRSHNEIGPGNLHSITDGRIGRKERYERRGDRIWWTVRGLDGGKWEIKEGRLKAEKIIEWQDERFRILDRTFCEGRRTIERKGNRLGVAQKAFGQFETVWPRGLATSKSGGI